MSIADINAKVAAAVAANDAGDIATALQHLRSARMLLVATPDSQGKDGLALRWDRSAIDSMIKDLESTRAAAAASRAGGIRRTKVKYVRTGGCL